MQWEKREGVTDQGGGKRMVAQKKLPNETQEEVTPAPVPRGKGGKVVQPLTRGPERSGKERAVLRVYVGRGSSTLPECFVKRTRCPPA